jgi:3-hydroxybutyryl-CoA dehydrogenase
MPAPRDAPAGPAPACVVAHGDLGPASALLDAAETNGIAVQRSEGREPYLDVDGVALRLTDGSLAAEHGARPTVLFDLALDYAACARIVISAAPGNEAALASAAGFLQRLGKRVSILPDFPGLVVMRTVAALANEAASMLSEGVSAEAIDLGMTLGTNYPLGPLAWAERIGWERVLRVLEHASRLLGAERYQPALAVRGFALARTSAA